MLTIAIVCGLLLGGVGHYIAWDRWSDKELALRAQNRPVIETLRADGTLHREFGEVRVVYPEWVKEEPTMAIASAAIPIIGALVVGIAADKKDENSGDKTEINSEGGDVYYMDDSERSQQSDGRASNSDGNESTKNSDNESNSNSKN